MKFDMSAFDFGNSGCAWCHPGGGALEYDRDGYRYDNKDGGFFQEASTPNPSPALGDYYTVSSATLTSKASTWQSGGVAEVDCLMCHLGQNASGFRYSNLERNYAPPAQKLGLAASLGLAGRAGVQGLLNIASKGTPTQNPNITQSSWNWADIGSGAGRVPGTLIEKSPSKESCTICHFADKKNTTPAALQKGPANKPLDFTAFQKLMAAGSTDDGDEKAGVNGKDGKNDAEWRVAKGRVEGGKRGESINDPLNADAHMDSGMSCVVCHYSLSGEFDALISAASGSTIQPAVSISKIDHQFAKGDNTPDGKNMDQIDNTVTCASCHITKTHPNAGTAPVPTAGHAGIPAFHFDRINCKTCHIPYLNGPVDQILADFSVGPYQIFERTQVTEAPATGIGQRPLYMQRVTEHGSGHREIQPFGIMGVAVWANCLAQDGEDCSSFTPTFQRLGKGAAEALRTFYGDADLDGVYDWTLNRPQGGDTTLIVNTQDEIKNMISQLVSVSGNPSLRPILHFYFNQFAVSHNIRPKNAATNPILGSAAGGGCVMCHSSSDSFSPLYSSKSVGFFDKSFMLFKQPVDGGSGLVQTTMNDSIGALKRINLKFPYVNADGSKASLNLMKIDGEPVQNMIGQGDVLGFAPGYLASLLDPQTAGVAKPGASFSWMNDGVESNKVNFDASSSTCSGTCTYTWDFGDAGTGSGQAVSRVYAAAGQYSVSLTVDDTQYGFTSTSTVTVTAKSQNTAPVASRTAPAVSNMSVSFTDTSTDAQDAQSALAVTFQWGDGSSSTGAAGSVFSKTYTLGGSYTIKHSVADTGGLMSSSANSTVTITQKYSISGAVSDSAGLPLTGVTMYLKSGTTVKKTVTTASDGTYSLDNLLKGCYYVVPSKTGKTFSPSSRTVCVGPSKSGIDFTAL